MRSLVGKVGGSALELCLEFGWNGVDVVGIGRQVPIHSLEDGATQIVLSYALVTVRGLTVGI